MNPLSGTDLICCDGAGCNKAYHATCAGIEDINALPETWYCPSCTIRSRISANNVQSQSKVSSLAKQEAGSTAACTTVSSLDVPSSIAVKKDTAYDDDTDDLNHVNQVNQARLKLIISLLTLRILRMMRMMWQDMGIRMKLSWQSASIKIKFWFKGVVCLR